MTIGFLSIRAVIGPPNALSKTHSDRRSRKRERNILFTIAVALVVPGVVVGTGSEIFCARVPPDHQGWCEAPVPVVFAARLPLGFYLSERGGGPVQFLFLQDLFVL
jgi:hypothetical protein